MEKFLAWVQQLRFDAIWQTAIVVAASLLCITFHETAHGLAAYWLGDRTAKRAGRLSLNPLRHVDIGGLIMMAICHFGWAKPVPVDMRNFKNPKAGMALTALAGPAANVLLAYAATMLASVCAYFYVAHRYQAFYYIWFFFYYIELMSAGLAVFNLFPVPPLDGSKVLFALLPDRWYEKLMYVERYGMIMLMVLLLTGVLDTPLEFLRGGLTDALEAIGAWPIRLLYNLSV